MPYLDRAALDSVFASDEVLAHRGLARHRAGELDITSGRIVACDPLARPGWPAFAREVPTRGARPVEVFFGCGVPALLVLWFVDPGEVDPEVVSWTMALLADQEIDGLGAGQLFGYPVESGLGCVMDAQAAAALTARGATEREAGRFASYADLLNDEMLRAGDPVVSDHRPLGDGSPNNLVIVQSGFGSDVYGSYWGLGPSGDPVVLVTDFRVARDGDARPERVRDGDLQRAAMEPARLRGLETLLGAVEQDDAQLVREVVADTGAGLNDIIPSTGETAIATAIRLDRPRALSALLDGGALPVVPQEIWGMYDDYAGYAHSLRTPRSAELLAALDAAQGAADDGTCAGS